MDPADPWNLARAISDRAGAPAERDVFIQYISRGDYIPTALTEKFIAVANAGDANRCPASLWEANGLPDFARPGFLLYRFNGGDVTDAAQRQAAGFLATGTVEPEPLPSARGR